MMFDPLAFLATAALTHTYNDDRRRSGEAPPEQGAAGHPAAKSSAKSPAGKAKTKEAGGKNKSPTKQRSSGITKRGGGGGAASSFSAGGGDAAIRRGRTRGQVR